MTTVKDAYERRQPAPLPPRPAHRSPLWPWLIRLPLLGATALLLLFFIFALFVAVHQLQYDALIYPGVSAYGIDLSGMTREQAIQALSGQYSYGERAVFTFRDGARAWQKTAKELGVSFDPRRTVEEAYQVGRAGNIFSNLSAQSQAWLSGYAIQPMIVFDQSKASAILDQIAAEIDRPVRDATITLTGTTVQTTPSQVGREMDVRATLGKLREVILNMTTGAEISLIITDTQPTAREAETVAARIRTAVSAPIQLYLEGATGKDGGPWQATPEFISGMLSVKRIENGDGTAHYDLSVNPEPLRTFLQGLAPQLSSEPVNARFVFNDATSQLAVIKDSVDGRELDIETTLKTVQGVLFQKDNRRIALAFRKVVSAINSKATAADLGITERIVMATTFFYGSTAERRTNIQVAASRFHGLVIAPGEAFSFNKYLGDVSPETGYETGLVIYGNKTIRGVGGGVCQVSTTVFQAAFFAGFPIKERYAHGYRVGYYETGTVFANGQKYNSGVGMDATVYSPIIDLKFVNDTPYHLLIESYYEPAKQSLTFKFYSTDTGRMVVKDGPSLSNPVPHGPTKYTESADMRPGQERQIDYAVDGVDAHVYRTIRQGNQILINREEFLSRYLPWSAQFLVAPGYAPKEQ